MEKPLQLRFLPEADARALFERLGRAQARQSLRW
jgi:putative membrane protein